MSNVPPAVAWCFALVHFAEYKQHLIANYKLDTWGFWCNIVNSTTICTRFIILFFFFLATPLFQLLFCIYIHLKWIHVCLQVLTIDESLLNLKKDTQHIALNYLNFTINCAVQCISIDNYRWKKLIVLQEGLNLWWSCGVKCGLQQNELFGLCCAFIHE